MPYVDEVKDSLPSGSMSAVWPSREARSAGVSHIPALMTEKQPRDTSSWSCNKKGAMTFRSRTGQVMTGASIPKHQRLMASADRAKAPAVVLKIARLQRRFSPLFPNGADSKILSSTRTLTKGL
jgi:hypothetical protein